jgi:hypothetical protein
MTPDNDFTIRVIFKHPPIPIRHFDWLAYVDGQEESGLHGTAEEPLQAVRNLLDQIEEA